MKIFRALCAFALVCSLAIAPAAIADQGKGETKKPATAPNGAPVGSPDADYGAVPKGNAYGVRCKGFSKKHVKGTKGTPFSQCVKAMAQLKKKSNKKTAKQACKALSKKKRKGQKKSDFAKCVVDGNAVLKIKKTLG